MNLFKFKTKDVRVTTIDIILVSSLWYLHLVTLYIHHNVHYILVVLYSFDWLLACWNIFRASIRKTGFLTVCLASIFSVWQKLSKEFSFAVQLWRFEPSFFIIFVLKIQNIHLTKWVNSTWSRQHGYCVTLIDNLTEC